MTAFIDWVSKALMVIAAVLAFYCAFLSLEMSVGASSSVVPSRGLPR